jgi:hypothetical protein
MEHEVANQHKIAIPDEIQPKSPNDWSNIKIAKVNLQKFGGNSVYPFIWVQNTKLTKKEVLNVLTHNQISS